MTASPKFQLSFKSSAQLISVRCKADLTLKLTKQQNLVCQIKSVFQLNDRIFKFFILSRSCSKKQFFAGLKQILANYLIRVENGTGRHV